MIHVTIPLDPPNDPPPDRDHADRCGDHFAMLLSRHVRPNALGKVRRRDAFSCGGVDCRADVAFWPAAGKGRSVPGVAPGTLPMLVAEVVGSSLAQPGRTRRFRWYAEMGVWELVRIDPAAATIETWCRYERGRRPTLLEGGLVGPGEQLHVYSTSQRFPADAVFDAAANLKALCGATA